MITCGWCGHPTEPGRCRWCDRDAALPWLQRGEEPPVHDRLSVALSALGQSATTEQIAEYLDVDPRTVRRWRANVRRVS